MSSSTRPGFGHADTLPEGVAEGAVQGDGRWRVDYCNRAMEAAWGVPTPADPYARVSAWLEAVAPEDRQDVERQMGRLAAGESVTLHFRVTRPLGGVRWLRFAAGVVGRDGDGVRFVAIGSDLTDLAAAGVVALSGESGDATPPPIRFEADLAPGRDWSVPRFGGAEGMRPVEEPGAAARRLLEAVHPDDRDRVRQRAREVAEGGEPVQMVYRVVRRNGGVRWKRLVLTRLGLDRDRVRVSGLVVDITAFRDREERLGRLIDGLGHAVLELEVAGDGRARVVYASSGLERLLERSVPPHPTQRARLLVSCLHPDDRNAFVLAVNEAHESGVATSATVRVVRPDGGLRRVDARLADSASGDGARRLSCTLLDVTARREGGERLSRVLDAVGDAVMEVDVPDDGPLEVRVANAGLPALTGRPVSGDPVEVAGILEAVLHPEDQHVWAHAVRAVAAGDGPAAPVLRVVQPNGTHRHVRAALARTAREGGRVSVGCVLHDLSGLVTASGGTATGGDGGLRLVPPVGAGPAADACPLTDRQLAVLRLIGDGAGTDEVAERLGIRAVTVANHVASILRRLEARSRLEAVAKARQARYID